MKRIFLTAALALSLCFGAGAQMPRLQMPQNLILSQTVPYMPQGRTQTAGRSYNFSAAIFVYPDRKLSQDEARQLVADIDFSKAQDYAYASVYVLNPVGDKYDAVKDFDAFVEMFNIARSGNLKVMGIGQGATFVNSVIAPKAAGYIAGILTIGGKPVKLAKDVAHDGVPAYVAGANAAKVSAEYIALNDALKLGDAYVNPDEPLKKVIVNSNAQLSLKEIFDDAWESLLRKNYRFNNYRHTHYEGCKFGEYGIYELEPYAECEDYNITRTVVEYPMGRDQKPWLWYEYMPNELAGGAEEHSVPVMVLLHGNTNDPRTQAETSGFIELAGKERFFVLELEWQGSANYGAMGHDGIESTILMVLDKYPQLDPSRVYAEGLSAGSMTATAVGVKKSHIFAAVGGHSGGLMGGGARPSPFPGYAAINAEATQKRGAVEVPYCSVLGTADMVVPFITPANYKGNGYLNAWNVYQNMNGMPVVTDLDFSLDPLFGQKLEDRETIVTNKGAGITIEAGQLYKGDVPMIKFVAVVDYGHWNFKPTAQIMWDFFKQYSRDPQTKKLIYHGK